MNTTQLQAYWKDLSNDIKHHWKRLTDDDLKSIDGEKDRFIDVIQQKYGLAQEHAKKSVEKFMIERPLPE